MPAQAPSSNLTLRIPPDPALAGAVLSLAEAAGRLFGLERGDVLRLTLALEEIYLYACQVADGGTPLSLSLCALGPSVLAEWRLQARELSPRTLNFAATVAPGQAGEAEMGLFLASRTTDRCRLVRTAPGAYALTAEIDRSYPEADPLRAPLTARPPLKAEPRPPEEVLRQAAMLGAGQYPARLCPQGFHAPGRLLAQVRDGLYEALAVTGEDGRPAGLILWRGSEGRAVLFSGPYVFDPARREEIARMLVEGLIAALARTPALSIISERPTPDLPPGYFEPLGALLVSDGQGGRACRETLYRALAEDGGGAVWTHASLEDFLRSFYETMALARDLLAAPDRERDLPAHSLLAARVDRRQGQALLRPLLDGQDLAENLAGHVRALASLGIADVFLHLDLAQAWQATLAPDLVRAGFTPRVVLPQAGTSDILVFEHADQSC